MLRPLILNLLLLLAACSAFPACAVQAAEPQGYRLSLFNGQNLEGWHALADCKAGVEEGVLVLQDGNGMLRTDHRYRDCILELECRARKTADYDSGIYFRAETPPASKPFPSLYQINLKQGEEGNGTRFEGAKSTGLYKPGEWNRYKLTIVGHTAAMEINGSPAWKTDTIEHLDGYLGLQCEVPLGGQFEFRNIYVTELGYDSLFNGKDLTGWVAGGGAANRCWEVEEGLLVCTGQKGTWLRSAKEYGDFNLRLDYKIKPGGNSGVYVRVPENGTHHGDGSGVEVQILDDQSPRYKTLKVYQYCGGVYDFAGPKEKVGRPAGEWNSMEIDCQGSDFRVTLNGVLVTVARGEELPALAKRRLSGFLGLQNHSEAVWFKNLRVGPPMKGEAQGSK
jgi:hypothetical protein